MFKTFVQATILLAMMGGVAAAAEDGVRRYGKCWVERTGFDGTTQLQGYDCSAANVECPSGSFGSKCKVNGVAGTVGPATNPFQFDQRRSKSPN
ncbi:MAG: hypothetical protein ACO1OG_06145 [Devosia sp.]